MKYLSILFIFMVSCTSPHHNWRSYHKKQCHTAKFSWNLEGSKFIKIHYYYPVNTPIEIRVIPTNKIYFSTYIKQVPECPLTSILLPLPQEDGKYLLLTKDNLGTVKSAIFIKEGTFYKFIPNF